MDIATMARLPALPVRPSPSPWLLLFGVEAPAAGAPVASPFVARRTNRRGRLSGRRCRRRSSSSSSTHRQAPCRVSARPCCSERRAQAFLCPNVSVVPSYVDDGSYTTMIASGGAQERETPSLPTCVSFGGNCATCASVRVGRSKSWPKTRGLFWMLVREGETARPPNRTRQEHRKHA